MSTIERESARPKMTTGKGIGIYMLCWLALFCLIGLAEGVKSFPGIAVAAGYLAAGFVLNRVVLRGLIEWHPMYNTLSNVSTGKLKMLIFWPLTYPVLFFQLLVSKHL
jgi:hypothetical protein